MTHYDITQWSDFVRGLVDRSTDQRMREVLDTSERARRQVNALRQVQDLADAESSAQPPEWAVRCAKALGGLGRTERAESAEPGLLDRIAMALSFDSFVEPALAGTRDLQTTDRQMTFESAGYAVELRLEPEADHLHSVVVGQLLHQADESDAVEPVADVPVVSRAGRDLVAVTGRFGEFQAEGLATDDLDLCFLLDDERCLEIQVGHGREPEPTGGDA